MYIRFVCHANFAASNSSSKMNKHTVRFENRLDKSSLVRACPLSNNIPMGQPNTPYSSRDMRSVQSRLAASCVQISHFTTHLPLRLPFSLSSKPRSIKDGVIRLIVRSDLPMCLAISVCFASGFSLRKRNTANSSKEQSKEHFGTLKSHRWHFETLTTLAPQKKIRFLKNNSRQSCVECITLGGF